MRNEYRLEKCFATDADMEKINRYTRRALSPDEVYTFTAVLCDNEVDRDGEKFAAEALAELKTLFEGKTGIADHSMKSADQRARIYDTYLEEQPGCRTADGETLCQLKAKVYMLRNEENRPLIEEIEAGIKKEVSVSCAMGRRVCSVCGKDNLGGTCEHRKGKTYGGRRCFHILSDATDAYEFSFVAVPAQRGAGVTKAFDRQQTEEETMTDIKSLIKSCSDEGITLTGAQANSLRAYVEELEDLSDLGEAYKKELSKEVIRLFSKQFPAMDRQLLSSVIAVMTAKELTGFREGLESRQSAAPQLADNTEKPHADHYTEFKI